MNIPPLSPPTAAPDPKAIPLEKLASNTALSDNDKIAALSRQFESLLLRQILQETRKTIISSNLMPDSITSSIYQDMVNTHIAESISQGGSFGIAGALQVQLSRQLLDQAKAT